MWNLKKSHSEKQRQAWWWPGTRGWRKWGGVGRRVETFNYIMNNVGDLYLKFTKGVDLNIDTLLYIK